MLSFLTGKSRSEKKLLFEYWISMTISRKSLNEYLLFFLLEQTGPARVYFTTWAISEYAIRQLNQFIEHGLILELKRIFDYRNGIRKPAELQFL